MTIDVLIGSMLYTYIKDMNYKYAAIHIPPY